MSKKIFLILLTCTVIIAFSSAQGIKVSTSPGTPDFSSILELESSTQGFLAPRMTQSERDLISSPAEGLIIYNTTSGCVNYYSSPNWLSLCGQCLPQPTQSNAGSDQLYVNNTTINLAANTPYEGSGSWSVVSGLGGSFGNAGSPSSTFTGIGGNSYTLRWTISNSCGSSQDEMSAILLPPNSCGIVTDIDNNVYFTVQIGSQCWMKQNLKVTKNPTGSNITRLCYDDIPSNCNSGGGLYSWTTLMNGQSSSNSNPSGVQGICPSGWHVPSDAEFCLLENTVEIGTDSGCSNLLLRGATTGTKLKQGGSSGFDALPVGAWWVSNYGGINDHNYFWTSRETDSSTAYVRYLLTTEPASGRYNGNGKQAGFSLRCVKN